MCKRKLSSCQIITETREQRFLHHRYRRRHLHWVRFLRWNPLRAISIITNSTIPRNKNKCRCRTNSSNGNRRPVATTTTMLAVAVIWRWAVPLAENPTTTTSPHGPRGIIIFKCQFRNRHRSHMGPTAVWSTTITSSNIKHPSTMGAILSGTTPTWTDILPVRELVLC